MIQDKATLKSFFNTGDQPSESNFEDLIDSMLLVNDQDWSDLNNTPTTIDGYGITDAVSLSGSETLSNKTLDAPEIISPTGLEKADVGLENVDNTSDAEKNSASVTLTNKTLTSPKINVGSDATGDLYYRDAGGNLVRLAVGSSGQVLKGGTVPSYASIVSILGYTPVNSAGDTMTGPLILDSDPNNALEAVTKNYVDNLVTGLTWKQSVVAGTTANITLSGTQTIDGIAVVAGDRVLVKDQTNATQNGIYVVATGAWSRAVDNDSGLEIATSTVLCEAGTLNAGTQWNCSNTTITLGSTNITFVLIAGAGVYTNGTGLSLSGNVFSIDSTVATLNGTQALANKTLTNPKVNIGSDATGDLYYRDASGNLVRLGVGTSSQVLRGGTVPAYATIATILGYTPVNIGGDTMTGSLVLNGNPVNALEAATKNYVDNAVVGRGIPIGSSIEYGGITDLNPDPESGAVFFLEDGRALSRTTYAVLFSRIGTRFGAGDGSTTFNIPNSAGKFAVAYDTSTDFNAVGKTGGNKTRTLAANNLPVTSPWSLNDPGHFHKEKSSTAAGTEWGLDATANRSNSGNLYLNTDSALAGVSLNNNTGGGQSFVILPPYIVKNKLIRVL